MSIISYVADNFEKTLQPHSVFGTATASHGLGFYFMSKDPAFLFYSSDFLTGTMFMDNEQVGKFIRLMCAQHQKGRLSEKDMLKICITHDEDIFSKFERDEAGLYFNTRLEEEVDKRKAYSESRRNNRKKKEDIINTSNSYVQHMENENEIEIDNESINRNTIIKEGFEKVWNQYGKVGSRKVAFERFKRLSQSDQDKVLDNVPKFVKNHVDAKKIEFIPHMSTYLSQERYNDQLPYQQSVENKSSWIEQFRK